MSKRIEIRMIRLYRVIDNETEALVFETTDPDEANQKAGFTE